MKKGWLVNLLILTGIHLTFAQAQKNMTLVGQLPYPAAELSNIWGYVDPQGREYALVGLTTGVSVVDLQNPAQPVEIQHIPGAVSDWREIKTWQNFAYATNETGGGLLIMDLSGLPDTVTYKDTVLAGINTSHTLWIADGWLYLNGPDQFEGGTAIFNLNPHPDRPVLTGTYEQAYVHDMYSRGDTAYLAEILEGTFTLLDISDRSNPEVIVTVGYPNAFTHNTWLNDAGTVCFTTDELPAASIIAWDISNPANIRQLDNIRSGLSKGKAIPHNVHVRNDYLISSYYRDGIHIADASRPGNLVEVGYYDTSPLENEGFNGVWGVYPFLPSGLVLASDIEGGLFVMQASLRRASWLEGSITDGETGEFLGDVELILGDSLSQEKSRTGGSYALGVADPGIYQLALYKYGYERDTLTVQLDSAIVTPLDIVLTPSPRVDMQVHIRESLSLAGIGGATLLARSLDGATEQQFTADASGNILLNRFVVNDYQFIAGKWGYLTAELTLQPDSNNNQINFLLQKGYADDFSLDLGWKVQSDLLRGAWERGKPITTFYGTIPFTPRADLPDDIGDEAYVTGNVGGNAFGFDVDNGYTRLISPPMDLRGIPFPQINFYRWWVNWGLFGPNPDGQTNDFLSVLVTNGTDTVEVRHYTGTFDTLWQEGSVPLAQYLEPDSAIQVIFFTQDLEPGNQDAVEAGIDGFRVTSGFPTGTDPQPDPGIQVSVLPGEGQISIQLSPNLPPGSAVDVFDLAGRRILSAKATYDWTNIPFPYPAGMYICRSGVSGAAVRFVYLP